MSDIDTILAKMNTTFSVSARTADQPPTPSMSIDEEDCFPIASQARVQAMKDQKRDAFLDAAPSMDLGVSTEASLENAAKEGFRELQGLIANRQRWVTLAIGMKSELDSNNACGAFDVRMASRATFAGPQRLREFDQRRLQDKMQALQKKAKEDLHTFCLSIVEEKTAEIATARHRIERDLPEAERNRLRQQVQEARDDEERAIRKYKEKLTEPRRPFLLGKRKKKE
nr:hypothetical protein BaRGS_034546 [Batillaria attramentaria]KAG5701965.1 hypothetical protein BaRGS_034547 [Batillaria attramentaria]KAG5701966.1 hypothetical protein BaRGS_034548 [Batillaria attramentaria]